MWDAAGSCAARAGAATGEKWTDRAPCPCGPHPLHQREEGTFVTDSYPGFHSFYAEDKGCRTAFTPLSLRPLCSANSYGTLVPR